jgi:hypothetical protein
MKFTSQRLLHDNKQTFGILQGEGFKAAFTLEDEPREVKVKGETRIPAGLYVLKIRKEETPLTLKHRVSYAKAGFDFKFHIEITNVAGFGGIYIHAGNDETHTDGCLLLGDALDLSADTKPLTKSTVAVKRFYELAYPVLEYGGVVHLEIRDENQL